MTSTVIMMACQVLENWLRVSLPDDLVSALRDGVLLCHLVNLVHPHTITCVHVPTPDMVCKLYSASANLFLTLHTVL